MILKHNLQTQFKTLERPVRLLCEPLDDPGEVIPPVEGLLLAGQDARGVQQADALQYSRLGGRALEPRDRQD